MRRLKQAALVFVVALAAAQLIRPDRTKPTTEESRAIRAHVGTASGLVAVLDRSCRDCHSNDTVWPWYTHVAPVSWLMASAVTEGRKVVNFSEWGGYSDDERRFLLSASCDAAQSGRMPGPWTWLHSEARLSPADIELICAAARQGEPHSTGGAR